MAELSLRELKAQNADAGEETEIEQDEPEYQEEVAQEEVEQPEVETEEEDEQEESESEEVESWMQEGDEATPEESNGFKPSPEAAAVRKKLRAKLGEKDDELEKLKQELEQLKAGKQQAAPQAEKLPPRPKLEDFDYDEDKHADALDDWYDRRAEAKAKATYESSQTEAQQREQSERQKREMDEALEAHYTRAEKLVTEGKVSADKYHDADRIVRKTLDSIRPGEGDGITDFLIKTLNAHGEGSEKVMYKLGVDAKSRAELERHMRADPSGLSAAVFLGSLRASIASPAKRKSSAPKPTPEVKGNAGGSTRGDKMRKQYRDSTDVQTRITLKRQAKAKGINTNDW